MYGRSCPVVVPRTGKCWNGGRQNADHRDSAPADELGRIEYLVDIPDVGISQQRQAAQICELEWEFEGRSQVKLGGLQVEDRFDNEWVELSRTKEFRIADKISQLLRYASANRMRMLSSRSPSAIVAEFLLRPRLIAMGVAQFRTSCTLIIGPARR